MVRNEESRSLSVIVAALRPAARSRHATAEALDTIRRKYGSKAVTRARLVKAALPEPFERDPMTAVEHRGGARRGRGAEGPKEFVEQANEPVLDDSLGGTDGAEDLDTDA